MIFIVTFLVLALAALVLAYAAYPHRGLEMPYFPQLGRRMWRTRERIPTVDEETRPWVGTGS